MEAGGKRSTMADAYVKTQDLIEQAGDPVGPDTVEEAY
jgi:hypothetical protein